MVVTPCGFDSLSRTKSLSAKSNEIHEARMNTGFTGFQASFISNTPFGEGDVFAHLHTVLAGEAAAECVRQRLEPFLEFLVSAAGTDPSPSVWS